MITERFRHAPAYRPLGALGDASHLHEMLWPTVDELLEVTRAQRIDTMVDILRGTATVSVLPASLAVRTAATRRRWRARRTAGRFVV